MNVNAGNENVLLDACENGQDPGLATGLVAECDYARLAREADVCKVTHDGDSVFVHAPMTYWEKPRSSCARNVVCSVTYSCAAVYALEQLANNLAAKIAQRDCNISWYPSESRLLVRAVVLVDTGDVVAICAAHPLVLFLAELELCNPQLARSNRDALRQAVMLVEDSRPYEAIGALNALGFYWTDPM